MTNFIWAATFEQSAEAVSLIQIVSQTGTISLLRSYLYIEYVWELVFAKQKWMGQFYTSFFLYFQVILLLCLPRAYAYRSILFIIQIHVSYRGL